MVATFSHVAKPKASEILNHISNDSLNTMLHPAKDEGFRHSKDYNH